MKKIDIHVHIGKLLFSRPGISVRYLLNWMDEMEIEKACVMAVENPEEIDYYVTSERVIRSCRSYPDRLVPFCNVDPRRGEPGEFDPYPIIARYKERGAKGFGEMLAGLWIDDQRNRKIFAACEKLKLPVLIHIDNYRNFDQIGLPRLEKVLQSFPGLNFITHALHWWSEISAEVSEDDRGSYPTGPIIKGGRAEQLLQKYDNLFADLSADSGTNALTRVPSFTPGFLTRNQDKLLFGTDLVYKGQKKTIHEVLNSSGVDTAVLEKIYYLNAKKVLGM
ncbi:amidohydrolase family protein [candidate division KSB1 bacterium]|nr:amidohydrolase family protein [candidate division KSB1 bacterium]